MSGLSAGTVMDRMHAARRTDLRRASAALALIVLALLASSALNIWLGSREAVALGEIAPALIGRGTPLADFVVTESVLPDTLAAALSGAMFGASGHYYQRTVRNALATPDIIGITAGASMGAVAVIVLRPAGWPGIRMAALAGALITIAAVCGLAWRRGIAVYRLILVGIGMSAVAAAVTSYLLLQADLTATAVAVRWTAGSTTGVTWPEVRLLALVAVICLGMGLVVGRGLGVLRVGDDLARGLGVRVTTVRIATLALGAVVAALTTSVTGPIAFVALVSGPIVTRGVPRGPHALLAALFGAALVSTSALVAGHAPLLSPVPVGAITAIVGAPVLLWLLLKRRDKTS